MWASPESISYNLHPPLLRNFGRTQENETGLLVPHASAVLEKRLKGLRGNPRNILATSAHRRLERSMIHVYRD